MLKKILLTIVAIVAIGQSLYAGQYYNFSDDDIANNWRPDGHGVSDVGGFKDTSGKLIYKGGAIGDEYIVFRENNTGYIYRVELNGGGNPNRHPDNSGNNQGSIVPRTFTYVADFPVNFKYATGAEFHIDDDGIYYGSGDGIKHWDWALAQQSDEANGGLSSQTLARNTNITDKDWWTSTSNRRVHKYNKNNGTWEYQFTYPDLGGSHHDGMEIVPIPGSQESELFISDMTSDKIIRYRINSSGVVADPSSYDIFTYDAAPYVEGMGFGPNNHFWIASGWGGTVYEIGDGNLTVTCSQTFHFGTHWEMSSSKCDDISVPAFDDTLMVTWENGQLLWTTDDDGAYNWLNTQGYNVSRAPVTLHSGEAFFTLGKFDTIDKTIAGGKLSSSYVNFHSGEYSLVGFSYPINLRTKFIDNLSNLNNIYYYLGGTWHEWVPSWIPQTNPAVPANQGLFVFPKNDFGMLVN